MSVFALGRLSHLGLLTEWHLRNPDSHLRDALVISRLSRDRLIAILAGTP